MAGVHVYAMRNCRTDMSEQGSPTTLIDVLRLPREVCAPCATADVLPCALTSRSVQNALREAHGGALPRPTLNQLVPHLSMYGSLVILNVIMLMIYCSIRGAAAFSGPYPRCPCLATKLPQRWLQVLVPSRLWGGWLQILMGQRGTPGFCVRLREVDTSTCSSTHASHLASRGMAPYVLMQGLQGTWPHYNGCARMAVRGTKCAQHGRN